LQRNQKRKYFIVFNLTFEFYQQYAKNNLKMYPTTLKEKLKERIKELECLYEVSNLLYQQEGAVADVLKTVGLSVKKALLHPDAATVELRLDDFHSLTGVLPKDTVFIESRLDALDGSYFGFIKVHYPKPIFSKRHFLKEEKVLLSEIANSIGAFYERHLNREREAVVRNTAKLVDRLSILAEITAGIAHEINTPLGNILGYAELLAQKKLDAQSAQDVNKIRSAAIYSREIVKKLMFFSCEMPYSSDWVEIKSTVTQVLSILEHKFAKQAVFYRLEFDDDQLKARLDSVQFSQILFNLLLNALYVSPEGSTIKVKVTHDKNFFYIAIADEGPGIPDAIKAKVFEPFFTTKPLGEGTGLGLSVVHGIVKSHQGDILIRDNQPKGTVFTIVLPF